MSVFDDGGEAEPDEAEGEASDDGEDDAGASTKSCPICMKDVAADATGYIGFIFDV